PVVGITGTNGKTATKELLARALGVRWSVHATRGSLNNEIGVPLTILAAPDDTDALVVEAGASERGEIERLRRIIVPTAAIVTNVSTGHVEGFGSLEAVLEEKLFMLHGVNSAVVGTDPPDLIERARALGVPATSAGLGNGAEVRPDSWCLDGIGRPELVFRGQRVRIPLLGRHQGENVMLVLALAEALGLDIKSVAEALETVTLPDGRCQLLQAGGLTVLNDSYNANPASFAAALETAAVLRGRRPLVVIVGTMLELGPTTIEAHESVADAIVAAEPAVIGALGAFVPALERHHDLLAGRLVIADEAEELGRRVASRLAGSEFVLLKASRGMQLERALPHILPHREAQCSTTS
ncbi:MAG: UDP-N-acetylmuramoyl-tripeptide--D-alanyl-D-alanine ligase, partial [Gemmatimonadales bacterium]